MVTGGTEVRLDVGCIEDWMRMFPRDGALAFVRLQEPETECSLAFLSYLVAKEKHPCVCVHEAEAVGQVVRYAPVVGQEGSSKPLHP